MQLDPEKHEAGKGREPCCSMIAQKFAEHPEECRGEQE